MFRNKNKIIRDLEEENLQLKFFKDAIMKFIKDTGLNPLILGYPIYIGEDYTYSFTREECEYWNTKIDTKHNPIHATIKKLFK